MKLRNEGIKGRSSFWRLKNVCLKEVSFKLRKKIGIVEDCVLSVIKSTLKQDKISYRRTNSLFLIE
jgi:hypothetical protein